MRLNEIYHGDCLEVMRSWPAECVDLVVTSPPYNIRNADGIEAALAKERGESDGDRVSGDGGVDV